MLYSYDNGADRLTKPPQKKRRLYAMALSVCSFVCCLQRVLLAAGAYRVGHSGRTDLFDNLQGVRMCNRWSLRLEM